MKRILVDRSIFHGDKFTQIQTSNLLHAVRSGTLQVYYTAGFIEETLRNICRDMNTFAAHWKYLYELNHQYWFKTPTEVVIAECTQQAIGAYYLRADDDINNTLSNVEGLIIGEKAPTILEPAIDATNAERKRMDELRRKILTLRQNKQFSPDDFESFVETNAENHFRDALLPAVGIGTSIISRWKQAPEEFPFTNYYIRCLLLTLFKPLANHQLAVHTNDKSDAGQLAFVLWTDVLVTDDGRFMTKAFDILNRGGQKECWTQSDLLNHVSYRRTDQ